MSIGKDHSLFGNPVNVRCGYLRLRVQGRNISKALVIGHDVNDVRMLHRSRRVGRLEPVRVGHLPHDDYQTHKNNSG